MSNGAVRLQAGGLRVVPAVAVFSLGAGLIVLALAFRTPIPGLSGSLLVFASLRSALIARFGRVDVWTDGIENRLLGNPSAIPLQEIAEICVVRTALARTVRVVDRDGSWLTLASPRTGLFFRHVDFDRRLDEILDVFPRSRMLLLVSESKVVMGITQIALIMAAVVLTFVFVLHALL